MTADEKNFTEKMWELRNLKSFALRKKVEAVIDEQLKEMKGVKKPKQTKKSATEQKIKELKEKINDINKQ